MDNSANIILRKLEEIDGRLRKIEGSNSQTKPSLQQNQAKGRERDSLYQKAVSLVEKYDEIPAPLLQRLLVVDLPRAEKILDQLEEAGLGQCTWEER